MTVYFYNLAPSNLSIFTLDLVRQQGKGECMLNFHQVDLFKNPECTDPIPKASLIFEWTSHTIDGIIQPYIDTLGLFLSDGQLEATTVTDVDFFKENVVYTYTVIDASGSLRCSKKIRIQRFKNDVHKVTVC